MHLAQDRDQITEPSGCIKGLKSSRGLLGCDIV
jgi:hypothetical protein